MPSTRIVLPQGIWTPIVTVGADGWVNHTQGDTKVVYVVASVAPTGFDTETPTSWETIRREGFEYDGLAIEESIYAFAINANAEVSVSVEKGVSLNLDADYFNGQAGIISQSYTEANSKLGTQHEGSILINDLPGGANNDTIFVTGALPVSLKGRVIGFSGDGVIASIYRAPTYTGGTPQVYQNASNINPVTGLSQILLGATITDIGTLAFAPDYLIGNTTQIGKGSTPVILGREKLLSPNTAYLFRIASLDSLEQNVSSLLSWYEGDLDLPRL